MTNIKDLKTMKIEIITTGDELMSGLTQDGNFMWAAALLYDLGFDVAYHTTVGDVEKAILSAFAIAVGRADAVIVTGGLGPTPDDLTAELASRFFGAKLEFSGVAYSMMEERLSKRGREVNESNRKQAYLPEGSEILRNNWGTAPGFSYLHGGVKFYFLPGVPREFMAMMGEYVVPDLEIRDGGRKKYAARLVKTFGIPESELAEMLTGIEREGVRLGYRSHFPEIHLRVSASGNALSTAEALLDEFLEELSGRLGDKIFTTSGETMEQVLGRLLSGNNMTLAVAESCTGGLLASRITDVPGSSAYFLEGVVTYSNEAKNKILGVPLDVLIANGAVSAPVVEAMASGVRGLSGSDIGVGISGIAGPGGGTVEKPVGTVYVGVDMDGYGVFSNRYLFHGDRSQIKLASTEAALNLIRKNLIKDV